MRRGIQFEETNRNYHEMCLDIWNDWKKRDLKPLTYYSGAHGCPYIPARYATELLTDKEPTYEQCREYRTRAKEEYLQGNRYKVGNRHVWNITKLNAMPIEEPPQHTVVVPVPSWTEFLCGVLVGVLVSIIVFLIRAWS